MVKTLHNIKLQQQIQLYNQRQGQKTQTIFVTINTKYLATTIDFFV
jgi:hypothetical protein